MNASMVIVMKNNQHTCHYPNTQCMLQNEPTNENECHFCFWMPWMNAIRIYCVLWVGPPLFMMMVRIHLSPHMSIQWMPLRCIAQQLSTLFVIKSHHHAWHYANIWVLSTEPMNENNENNFFECDDRCVLGRLCLFFAFAIAIAFVWGFSFFHYLSRLYILPPLPLPFWWCWCIPPPLGPRVLWICVCGLASAAQAWGVLLGHVCLPALWYFFCHALLPCGVVFFGGMHQKVLTPYFQYRDGRKVPSDTKAKGYLHSGSQIIVPRRSSETCSPTISWWLLPGGKQNGEYDT